jgi:hypothetical protein
MNSNVIEAIAEAAWMGAVYTLWMREGILSVNWYSVSNGERTKLLSIAKNVLDHSDVNGANFIYSAPSRLYALYVESLIELAREPDRAKVVQNAQLAWNPEKIDIELLRTAFKMLLHYVDLTAMKGTDDKVIFEQLVVRLSRYKPGMAHPKCSRHPLTVDALQFPFAEIVNNMLKGRKINFADIEKEKKLPEITIATVLHKLGFSLDDMRDPGDRMRLAELVEAVKSNKIEFAVENAGFVSKFLEAAVDLLHGANIRSLAKVAYGQTIARVPGEWEALPEEKRERWCRITKELLFAPVIMFSGVKVLGQDHAWFDAAVMCYADVYFSPQVVLNAREYRDAPLKRGFTLSLSSASVKAVKNELEAMRKECKSPREDAIKMQAAPGVNDKIMERVEAAERRETASKTDQREDATLADDATRTRCKRPCRTCNQQAAADAASMTKIAGTVGAVYTAYHPDDISYFPGAPDDVRDVLPTPLGQFTIGGNIFTIDAALIEGSPLVLRLFPNANNDLNQSLHTKRDFGILFRPPHGQGSRMGFRLFGLTARPETYTCQAAGSVFRETLSCTFDRIELWSPKAREVK